MIYIYNFQGNPEWLLLKIWLVSRVDVYFWWYIQFLDYGKNMSLLLVRATGVKFENSQ